MNAKSIERLLKSVKDGKTDIATALEKLKQLPFEDLGFATIDTHRSLRQGFPEVIFGEGKSATQIRDISRAMTKRGENVLITRLDKTKARALKKSFTKGVYNEVAQTFFIKTHAIKKEGRGRILVVSAGTSDMPVAEEAAVTAEAMGNEVGRLFDVGVSGIHRVLHKKDDIFSANVLIVVAGMEGALPSVIAGLVSRPVIAVPTSVGYGANLKGITTLLAMLTSCASGITVVNIDNGFGAAYAASLINR